MIKLVHISDTHLREFKAPPGDILVHSGDALNYGNNLELIRFRKQLEDIKDNYKHIVFVPGNHDWCFDLDHKISVDFLKETIENIHILHNEAIELLGIKFYGSSDQPIFGNWAFNRPSHELLNSYSNIPEDTEVLITHCPPHGIRDYVINSFNPNGVNVGSTELNVHLPRLKKLKAHLCGHIHYSYGVSLIDGVQYSNGALCNEKYESVNAPIEIEIDK